jgi:anti-anti-sigma factor
MLADPLGSEASGDHAMWSPFSRKSRRPHGRTDPSLEQGWASNVNNCIATIDRIGPTAVATLMVETLSTQQGVNLLMELFDEVSQFGAQSLVLDMQNLEYMDSVCLGCLVQSLNHAVEGGGRIALVNTEGNVQHLFRVTQLHRLFPICHDVPTALTAIERAA